MSRVCEVGQLPGWDKLPNTHLITSKRADDPDGDTHGSHQV